MPTQRMRTLPLPRFVDAETVQEGDTIRVSWKVGDVEHTRTGKVARILHDYGRRSRAFIARDGNEIAHWSPGSRVRVTLVSEQGREIVTEPLFEME